MKCQTNNMDKLERQLERCCDQMTLLHQRVGDARVRQQRAVKRGQRGVASSYKQQLQVLQSMYGLYYQTASVKAAEMERLCQDTQSVLIEDVQRAAN